MQGPAPVYSIADEHPGHVESAAWARFASASNDGEFYAAWLALLAARLPRARGALLLVDAQADGAFTVASAWPDPRRDLTYLGPTAQKALEGRRAVVEAPGGGDPAPDGPAHVAYPVEAEGRLRGAVVTDIGAGPERELQSALRQIHWASAWLTDHFRRRELRTRQAEVDRVSQLNELMATALQHQRLRPAALAVVNEMALRWRADRVSAGLERDDRIVPLAISHSATFDPRSDLVRALGEAMNEVLDIGTPLRVPRPPDEELRAIAHEQAALALDARAMLSVPLLHDGRAIGAITLERQRDEPFGDDAQREAAALGVMLGPVWALQQRLERPLLQRVRDAWRAATAMLFGPRYPGWKLAGVLAAALVAVPALWQVDHRVSARTVIEGATQIASVAPFDGYVAEAPVRAGDTVRQGQPMARLDDRDLQLERSRWEAEREQLQRRLQVAMAQADRGAMGVLAAQVNQAEAQLALAEERLGRAQIVAPFDGVVVSGDLSQAIGSPVQTGQTLFEVAPLEGFRVVLQVDERDIARVEVGQRGTLVLSSLPDRAMDFAVSSVTPVASQVDGRNVFRVEARVEGAPARLRPGMEGVGKVVVGERSLLWVWTHGFFDWLRVALWAWMP
jgi:RND family efflux transporter MFP subunit